MLGNLIARVVQPWTEAKYDRLFTPFAPNGAPPQLLANLYHEYQAALPDEFVPAQHKHFRELIQDVFGRCVSFDQLDGPALKRAYALYACCFERGETFNFQLAQWRGDPCFRALLNEGRERVIVDLLVQEQAERTRRARLSRWYECRAAAIDLKGASLLDLIKQMSPDDWHEIVLRWDWDGSVDELNWITSQRSCDRATALYALCSARPSLIATTLDRGRHRLFIRTLAARLEGGFYPNAELGLQLSMRQRTEFEREIATARATGESPWQLTTDLVTHRGRTHAPKYTLADGQVRYHYEHWLEHLAPGLKR
jgi:hypothetical protein